MEPAAERATSQSARPPHHCPPSLRLDCQIVDLMYGAQRIGALRVNQLDGEIAALKRVIVAANRLEDVYSTRVAHSWVGYNEVLFETADRFFD